MGNEEYKSFLQNYHFRKEYLEMYSGKVNKVALN